MGDDDADDDHAAENWKEMKSASSKSVYACTSGRKKRMKEQPTRNNSFFSLRGFKERKVFFGSKRDKKKFFWVGRSGYFEWGINTGN